MGMTFKKAEQWLPTVKSDSVFVEIGSDRYEGSTTYFADLAVRNGTVLHTVDLLKDPQERVNRNGIVPGITWHQADGVEWSRTVYPTINKPISCLYLDNFDYNWNVTQHNPDIEKQKQEYMEQWGIVMNNQNCQVAHLQQMMALLPYMAEQSIVVCDDTYLSNDCWIGKCGAVVVFLQAHGYCIVDTENVGGYSYGVILLRN
jgi:cephalosporin hydroxylase